MFFLLFFAIDLSAARELEASRRWADAAALYEAALSDPGSDRFELQRAIAEMRFNQGDYAGTRRWLRQAESSLGGANRDTPGWDQLRNARAALYLVDGNLSAALRTLTGVRPFAGTIHSLASVEAQAGDLVRAEEHERQALALFRQQQGDRHESVQRALVSLSTIQALRGNWHGAEGSLREAMAIRETDEVIYNYVAVLGHLRRHREADLLRRRVGALVQPSDLVDVRALGRRREAVSVGVR